MEGFLRYLILLVILFVIQFQFRIQFIEKSSNQIPYVHIKKIGVCDICYFAKQRSNFSVRVELCMLLIFYIRIYGGPYYVPSVHNHCYFLTVVDDFNRYIYT